MTEHEASRTLVKSRPELWAECSDASSLARHLRDSFGEIKITRLEPETAVAWEGERASGTVRLEPAGWGTKVVLTATVARAEAVPVAESVVEPPAMPGPSAAAIQPPSASAGEEPALAAVPSSAAPASEEPATTTGGHRRPLARFLAFLRGPAPPAHGPAPQHEGTPNGAPPAVKVQPHAADAAGQTPEPEMTDSVAEAADGQGADPPATAPKPEPVAPALDDTQEALAAALDSLGQAHHRPFSRA
jgi:hypothetical protein